MNRFGTAAILAGGKSKRMGFDKQRICVNDQYLIDLLYEELNKLFEHVIIVSNSPKIYSDRPYHVVSDEIEYGGPLTGIHKALKESQSEFVFITACDMPNLNHELIELMKSRLGQDDYCGSVSMLGDWIEPFHGFYSIKMIEKLENFINNEQYKISKLLNQFHIDYIPEKIVRTFTPDWKLFRNLNSIKDLQDYLRELEEKYDETIE